MDAQQPGQRLLWALVSTQSRELSLWVRSCLTISALCTLLAEHKAGTLLWICVLEWLGRPVAWALSDSPLAAQRIHHLTSLDCFPGTKEVPSAPG